MAKRRKFPLSKSRLQSAITNGRHLLRDIDGRGPEMRRLKDLLNAHLSDLGGSDAVSHSERILVGRASMLTLLLEMKEQDFARQRMRVDTGDLDSYGRCVNTLRRVFETVGLKRRAKEVPSLEQYLAGKARDKDIEAEVEEVVDEA
jgi:hypothetical protein